MRNSSCVTSRDWGRSNTIVAIPRRTNSLAMVPGAPPISIHMVGSEHCAMHRSTISGANFFFHGESIPLIKSCMDNSLKLVSSGAPVLNTWGRVFHGFMRYSKNCKKKPS
ncbi:MAG: hypothetical protein QHH74_16240 [Spirochaetota bacterium]|nr:hypothetical protein [Spirochaetota bacterium]